MVGDFENEEKKGIIPRAFDYIFDQIKKIKKNEDKTNFSIEISFIQIYLELIQDLFEPNNNVKIREDPEKGVYLEGVKWIKVESTKDCEEAFQSGEKNRKTAETKMNATSSRSHALLIAKIRKKFNDKDSNSHVMTESYLYLVDLAGSERVNKTNAKDDRLKEAKKINYSLLVLGNCIQSLIDPRNNHISYRDSKLTRILQESLGGNAKTSLIVTVSPSGYNTEETYSSLNFGARAMKVKNKPIINQTQDYQSQLIKLQEEYDKLMEDYTKLKIAYDNIYEEYKKIKNGEKLIELQRNSIANQIQSSDDLINSLKGKKKRQKNNNNENYDDDKDEEKEQLIQEFNNKIENLNEEMKNLDEFYRKAIEEKNEQYKSIILDLDNKCNELENEIEKYKKEKKNLNLRIDNIIVEKDEILKDKEELLNSYGDVLEENNNLKKELDEIKMKREKFEKETELFKKNEEIKKKNKKNESIQTPLLVEDNIKSTLEKIGVSIVLIAKNDINSILKQLLSQYNKYYIDKNIIEQLKKENKNCKQENQILLYEKQKLNSIIVDLNKEINNQKSLFEESQKKINELENDNSNYLNELNDIKEQLKDSNIKSEELTLLSNKLENYENNLNQELLTDIEQFTNIQKNINNLYSSFINEKKSKVDSNLNKLKNQITKIENLFNELNNNKNESENQNLMAVKNLYYSLFNSHIQLSKELYEEIKVKLTNLNKKGKNEDLLKRAFLLKLSEMFVKDSENKNDIKNALLNVNKTTYPEIIQLASSMIDNMNINSYNTNSIKKSQIIDAIDTPKEKLNYKDRYVNEINKTEERKYYSKSNDKYNYNDLLKLKSQLKTKININTSEDPSFEIVDTRIINTPKNEPLIQDKIDQNNKELKELEAELKRIQKLQQKGNKKKSKSKTKNKYE